MPAITMLIGVMLILVGIGGYGYSAATLGHGSPTALIPAAIGLIITVLGFVAMTEKWRKHAMHGAVVIGLLGFLGTIMGVFKLITYLTGTPIERPAAAVAQTVTAVLCFIFVALCVKSFIDARRKRIV